MIRKGQAHHHVGATPVLVAVLVWLVACGSDPAPRSDPSVLQDSSITIASFDFDESEILAALYGQALEARGFEVEVLHSVGPRELVLPALIKGLIELVPEYAGTSLAFVSLGSTLPSADPADTHESLVRALARDGRVIALAPSPAQNANAIVVRSAVAEDLGLRTISDLARVDDRSAFGGPPECPSRPFCLLGLETVYGLEFEEFVPLDAGGPMTRKALTTDHVDVGLLFTTDPAIGPDGFVALADDLGLQPAENVTPLVNSATIARWGTNLTDVLDDVSGRLTTTELRDLNGRVADGASPEEAAAAWLVDEGLV